MTDFSDEAKVILLKMLAKNKFLYDPNHPDHRSITKRSDLWEEIGNMLDKSPEACKSEWNSLKTSYKKSTAQRTTENSKFFIHMTFLDEVKQVDNPQQSIDNNLGAGNRESELNNTGQKNVQASLVQVQVNVLKCEEISVPVCKKSTVAGPKLAPQHQKEIDNGSKSTTKTPQKKNKENAQKTDTTKKKENIDKKTGATPKRASLNTKADDLDEYCRRVRDKLGYLPNDLLKNAKEVIDRTLSDLMEKALSRGRTSGDSE